MSEFVFNQVPFDKLELKDLYGILRSRSEVFIIEQNIMYQDMDFIDFKSLHFFVKEGGEVITYLRLIPPGVKYPEASIGRVLTLKNYRRKGLSKNLIEKAISYCLNNNWPIKIEAQAYLEDFYKRLGFETVSSPFILEGINHVSMIYNPESTSK